MLPHVRGRGGDSEPTTACLSEDVVVGFLDGTLAGAERERVELHVDACAACFGWLAAMIRSSLLQSRGVLADTLPLGDSPPLIGDGGSGQVAPGTMIGRYRVVGQLGQGAMGVVHRAFDPMLEREVAIKVLRGGASSGVRLRALDEAQALAKLQHPNVIAVYDVGFFADQVFVAMELVEGGTLADWLQERRPWQKVRDLFLQAARGLGAAHAAGLVHRDFKPANVLLTADGARVVVTDFGLVCSLDVDRPPTSGELAGTPAYMAPEQFAGGAIDPRTDIFNFCAALYEALFGQPAFAGDTASERRTALREGRLRPVRTGSVPRWLHKVLLRGLALRADDRFATVDELMVALERDRRLRRWALASAAVALIVIVAVCSAAIASYRSPLDACRRRAGAIGSAWSPEQRSRLASVFARVAPTDGPRSAAAVAQILDRFVGQWSRAYGDACDATFRRGEQSLEAFELRLQCLDTRRAGVEHLVTRLESADRAIVESSVSAVSALESPASCARERPSPAQLPPPHLKDEIATVRRQLEEAHSDELVGRLADADRVETSLLPAVERIGFAPLTAELWKRVAYTRRAQGKPADAEKAFLRAFDAAERSGEDRLRVEIATELVETVGRAERRFAEGRRWAAQADAIAARLGSFPDEDRAALAMNVGLVAQAEGKLDEAERQLRSAVELRRHADAPLVPITLGNLANVLTDEGKYEEAERLFRQQRQELERLVGPGHPWLLTNEGNLAATEDWLGHYSEARRLWLEILPQQIAIYGPHHPFVVTTLFDIADSEASVADYEHAIAHATQALQAAVANDPDDVRIADFEIALAVYCSLHGEPERAQAYGASSLARYLAKLGGAHPSVGAAEYQLGRMALDVHDVAQAKLHGERSLRILERSYGERNPQVAMVFDLLGIVEYEEGRYAAAIAQHQRALAILEPAHHMALPDVLTNLGRAQLASGHRDEARATLERAAALRRHMESDPQMEAATSFALARALAPESFDRARPLAEHALAAFVAGGKRYAREAHEVKQWLQFNPPRRTHE